MFEEFLEHRKFLQTSSKRSQLAHLIKAQTIENVIGAIVQELPTRHLTHQQKQILRRRITEEYAKQPIPEATFETWHSLTEPVDENSQEEDQASDSDENRDARHPNGRKKRKRKRIRVVKSDEYKEGDFDLYVKEKLVKEMAASLAEVQQSQHSESPQENQGDQQGSAQVDEEVTSMVDSDEELEIHPDTIYARKKLHDLRSGTLTSNLAPQTQWAIDRFIAMSWGWDVAGASHDISDYSLIKLHVRSLRILLHASILERKWHSAFKVFCVLVRFDWVDKRAIWPLGMEILIQRKRELLAAQKLPKLQMNRETQFLEWISLLYPATRVKFISTRTYQGPVYRSGSRTHAPLSIITGLWHLLVEQRFSRVRELLDDMLLHPPYASDGAYPFLLAMCCMVENKCLIAMFQKFDLCGGFFEDTQIVGDLADEPGLLSSKETIKSRIFNNNAQTRKMLDNCDTLGFDYPREELEAQLDETWELLGLRNPNSNTIRDATETSSEDGAEIQVEKSISPDKGDRHRAMISELHNTSKEPNMQADEALSLLDMLLGSSGDAERFEIHMTPELQAEATETAQSDVFEKENSNLVKGNSEEFPKPTKPLSPLCNNTNHDDSKLNGLVNNDSERTDLQQNDLEIECNPKSPFFSGSDKSSQSPSQSPIKRRVEVEVEEEEKEEEEEEEEELATKTGFSPTSSLPTQNSQRFRDRILDLSDREDVWTVTSHPQLPASDLLENEGGAGNNEAGISGSEDESTRFEDAVAEHSNNDAFSDSSDSETERYNKRHSKKSKKNKPMEMEFDFDF